MPSRQKTFQIPAWFSRKGAYLNLYLNEDSDKISCNVPVKSRLVIKSPKQLKGQVYLQLQARSNIISTLFYDFKSRGLSSDNGEGMKMNLVKNPLKSKTPKQKSN